MFLEYELVQIQRLAVAHASVLTHRPGDLEWVLLAHGLDQPSTHAVLESRQGQQLQWMCTTFYAKCPGGNPTTPGHSAVVPVATCTCLKLARWRHVYVGVRPLMQRRRASKMPPATTVLRVTNAAYYPDESVSSWPINSSAAESLISRWLHNITQCLFTCGRRGVFSFRRPPLPSSFRKVPF